MFNLTCHNNCHHSGIISQVDYLHQLGITAVWLSPIYKSPMVDLGYDVSNFYEIDPVFGTMEDFDTLQQKLHDLGEQLYIVFSQSVPRNTKP